MIRPEHLMMTSGDIATILDRSFRGPMTRIVVVLDDGTRINLDVASASAISINPGDRVGLTITVDKALIEAR